MRKTIYSLFAVAAMIFIAGCGNNGTKNTDETFTLAQIDSIMEFGYESIVPEETVELPEDSILGFMNLDISSVVCFKVTKSVWPVLSEASFRIYKGSTEIFNRPIHQLSGIRIWLSRGVDGTYNLHYQGVKSRQTSWHSENRTFNLDSDFKISYSDSIDFFGHGTGSGSPMLIGGQDSRDDNSVYKSVVIGDLYAANGASSNIYEIHFNDRSSTTGDMYISTDGTVRQIASGRYTAAELGVANWGCPPF